MNNQNGMLLNKNNQNVLSEPVKPVSDLDQYLVKHDIDENSAFTNMSVGMVQRGTVNADVVQDKQIISPKEDYEQSAPEKQIITPDMSPSQTNTQNNQGKRDDKKSKSNVADIIREKQNAVKSAMGSAGGNTDVLTDKKKPDQKSGRQNTQSVNRQPTKQTSGQINSQVQTQPVKNQAVQQLDNPSPFKKVPVIHMSGSIDDLCREYMDMFQRHFGLDLSATICYENMRKLVEPNAKDPLKTLYFIENTYRLSTLLYLTGNLPIIFVTSILAEKNRKNILKYVTIEVENGAKPYDDLLNLRKTRWQNKYSDMKLNDAMTVTPGVTMITPELIAAMQSGFDKICQSLRKFDKEMTGIVSKFDDEVRHDVTYIYSNWWYFLQGFENVPDMRAYVMAITDDTRKNLKI